LLVQFPLAPNRRHISLPESIKKFIAHQVNQFDFEFKFILQFQVNLASIKAPKHNGNDNEERNDDGDELMEIEQQKSTNQQFQQQFKKPFEMPTTSKKKIFIDANHSYFKINKNI
jgi:hypothetical protein